MNRRSFISGVLATLAAPAVPPAVPLPLRGIYSGYFQPSFDASFLGEPFRPVTSFSAGLVGGPSIDVLDPRIVYLRL